jgi:hypothetical protein
MGKYKIKYSYRTGDSFHTEDLEDILEYDWDDLEFAKESLKRIKEHYAWYSYKTNYYSKMDEVAKPEWHNVNYSHVSDEHYLMNIRMDNGKEVQFWPPWCGYFETLYGAEITIEGDSDMSFEI